MGADVIDIRVPDQEEGTKAEIRSWLKAVGDEVAEGELLVEVETDKVAFEVTAPAAGVLSEIVVAEGAVAPGAVIARLDAGALVEAPSHHSGGEGHHGAASSLSPRRWGEGGSRVSENRVRGDASREERLSASVRRLAEANGVDPAGLAGSGEAGRVTLADVEREVAREKSPPSPVAGSRLIPHSAMRRSIAERMAASVAAAPHVTAVFEADVSAVMAHRRAHKDALAQDGIDLTLTAYIVQACVAAMEVAPTVNSRWHEDALEVFGAADIGIGTALGEQGLIVPVLRDAGHLSLRDTAARLQELTARARAGKLTREDVRGGTFTISNHGVSGTLVAAPIVIVQPQTAILGVGKIEKRVLVRQAGGADAIQIRPMAYVTLTIDHRAIDGAVANAWLTRFVATLEGWPADGEA